ncbi:MAG: uroporphyrinogen-III synthase [Pseudomonadota bacterium]
MPIRKDALPPVVITRPIAQARAMQKKIDAIGRQSVVLPLLEIGALEDTTALDAALARLPDYALVAFVSPNAIDAAFARCQYLTQPWPDSVALAVMGEGSRQALATHGITASTAQIYSPADSERTDSQTLLAALEPARFAGKEVLILRGDSGRELLADALRSAGALVTQVTAYRRYAPPIDASGFLQLKKLLHQRCDWVITSSEALRVLMMWVEQLERLPSEAASIHVAVLQQQALFVPHVRIAETAESMGFKKILRTASGDAGLLAALQFRHE